MDLIYIRLTWADDSICTRRDTLINNVSTIDGPTQDVTSTQQVGNFKICDNSTGYQRTETQPNVNNITIGYTARNGAAVTMRMKRAAANTDQRVRDFPVPRAATGCSGMARLVELDLEGGLPLPVEELHLHWLPAPQRSPRPMPGLQQDHRQGLSPTCCGHTESRHDDSWPPASPMTCAQRAAVRSCRSLHVKTATVTQRT